MANALVTHKNLLPQAQKMRRAAQYVRMSTDYQRYSIENQAAAIAAYAQLHELSIVRTYRDDGESGLKIKNRAGLSQLLEDVRSGHVDFGHILVFDVSRWGASRTLTRVRTTSSSADKGDQSCLLRGAIRQRRKPDFEYREKYQESNGCRIQPRAFGPRSMQDLRARRSSDLKWADLQAMVYSD
jgi:hypothetical protein